MTLSAFGVEDPRISKADGDPPAKKSFAAKIREGNATPTPDRKGHPQYPGRLALGTVLPGFHGAVAGQKGHKLRAVGNEAGGTIAGSTVAGLATHLATRGRAPRLATTAGELGGYAGAYEGTARAERKGHYKPYPHAGRQS